jgi:hypothetical protein
VTKHAAVAFAEWLRIGYGRRGVRVSCLCPQSVADDMTAGGAGSAEVDGMLTPAQVAERGGSDARRDLPGAAAPRGAGLPAGQGANYDRWLGGMQKLYAVARRVAEQEGHHVGDLGRLAQALHRRAAQDAHAAPLAGEHGAARPARWRWCPAPRR